MGGTLRIVRTVADRNPDEWTSEMRADGFHGLAKVRVASSNLVIRSKVIPGERPFRGSPVASAVTPLYHFFRDALRWGLRMPWEDLPWEQIKLPSG